MKAIILAAGSGTRLREYTKNLPKGMLSFVGKTLLERQVETYRKAGINDIIIIKGYMPDKIQIPGVRYYVNADYANTNMVETLFCAEKELEGDIILSYSDILFEFRILNLLISSSPNIVVSVDTAWKDYWLLRYGNTSTDTESMVLANDDRIQELGQENPPEDKIHGRYVGLMKFSAEGIKTLRRVYHNARQKYWSKPWMHAKLFQKAYMTDLLQAVIQTGQTVDSLRIQHGWLEFDTVDDYEKTVSMLEQGKLKKLFDPEG